MLDQLVESKNNAPENVRKGRFLLTTFGLLASILLAGWTYSLFAKNYAMGNGEMEISGLVAPVSVTEEKPPAPEPVQKTEKTQASDSNKTILKELYEDMSRPQTPPKELSGEKDVINARQFGLNNVERGLENKIAENSGRTTENNEGNCGLCGNERETKQNKPEKDELDSAEVKQKPKPAPEPTILRTSNVINGKAVKLVTPPYPAAARPMRIEGAVNVQVTIDERGNVIAASAVSGNPMLRASAVQAARQSKFSPTILNNVPVKVTGIIVYNFKLQ